MSQTGVCLNGRWRRGQLDVVVWHEAASVCFLWWFYMDSAVGADVDERLCGSGSHAASIVVAIVRWFCIVGVYSHSMSSGGTMTSLTVGSMAR